MFDFAENKAVPDLAKVPSQFHSLYVEGDEGFTLSNDPLVATAVEALVGQSRALKRARDDTDAALKKAVDLSPLSAYGETPDAILAGVNEKIAALSKTRPAKQEEIDAQLASLRDELKKSHAAELAAKDERSAALVGQLDHVMRIGSATQAIVDAGGDPELLMPFLNPSLKTEEADGKFRVSVVDEDGKPRYSGATGDAMLISERVDELKQIEKFQPFFRSDKPSGGGLPPNQRPGAPRKPAAEMSSVDKIADGLAKGQTGGRTGALNTPGRVNV